MRKFLLLIFTLHCYFNIAYSVLNLDELKYMRYEVDILDKPTLKSEVANTLSMRSKYGQEYQCVLPDSELLAAESQKESTLVPPITPGIAFLLEPMLRQPCLFKYQDWWTYELCYGHDIKQYHKQDDEIVGAVISLGHYEYEFNWDNHSLKAASKQPKHHSQFYVNGSHCDINNQQRSTEVRYFCEENAADYIARVDEPSSCSYVVHVHTSKLCPHPYFRSSQARSHTISCQPLVSPAQLDNYRRKVQEEVDLANALKELLAEVKKFTIEPLPQLVEDKTPGQSVSLEDREETPDDASADQSGDSEKFKNMWSWVEKVLASEEYHRLGQLVPELSATSQMDVGSILKAYAKLLGGIQSSSQEAKTTMEVLLKHLKIRIQSDLERVISMLVANEGSQPIRINLITKFFYFFKEVKFAELQFLKWRAMLYTVQFKAHEHLKLFIKALVDQKTDDGKPPNIPHLKASFLELMAYKENLLKKENQPWKNLKHAVLEYFGSPDSGTRAGAEDLIKEVWRKSTGETGIEIKVLVSDLDNRLSFISGPDSQNLIVNLLMGHYEANREKERMDRLERNYQSVWKQHDSLPQEEQQTTEPQPPPEEEPPLKEESS